MRLWNRSGSAKGGSRRASASDEAIYLSDDAANAAAPERATGGPRIRDSHRRYDAAPAPQRPARRTLAQRLGLRRAANASDTYASTRIVRPAAAPQAAPSEPVLAGSPAPVRKPRRQKRDRSDFTLAALGITLGLTCALFPWYIFFNQDKFGVREFVFEGSREGRTPAELTYQPQLVGEHFTTGDLPRMDLDFLPTATLRNRDTPARAVPVAQQPFPSDLIRFRLVHVANGRAMIEDEDGLWVVQPGSRLPDASKVASIEQREGRWVLVTSLDRVVELEP